jgi:AraC-like DNA-binding protein
MINQVENSIPVYDLKTCMGVQDFAVKRVSPVEILGHLQVPHRNEGYNVTVLLKGRIIRYIDFEQYTIDAPAIICGGPDQVHQYVSAEKADMICVSFSPDFLLGEMKQWVACWECMFSQVILNPDDEELSELLVYTELMEREFHGNKAKKDIIIRNLLNAMIISIARMQSTIASVMQLETSTNKLVEQFKAIVDENFRSTTQVSQYAEKLNVTPGHLNDVIKSAIGKTAKQIIDEKRIMEAKRLLFWAQNNQKEIASMLSFEDQSYFNRFFKKHTGYTPSVFQRSIREKYN